MHNVVIALFPDQAQADEAVRALDALHRQGTVTVYATAVLRRDASGELSIDRHSHGGPLGHLLHAALGDELLDAVQRGIAPGHSALVGDLSEESAQAVDDHVAALGGTVTRRARRQVVASLIDEDGATIRAGLADISAEQAGRKADAMQSRLDLDLGNAKDKLQRAAAKLHERIDRAREEIEAKLQVLQGQAARASPEVRQRIQQRVTELRRDLDERERKLAQAYELEQAALQ